mgnify:CR=1 FL=1
MSADKTNLLSVENLGFSYGERTLFENISFGISQGEKIALIAGNGMGKSTLMKILTGEEPPESGRLALRKGLKVCHLPQEPELPAGVSVSECLMKSDNPKSQAIARYEKALLHPSNESELIEASEEMEKQSAWDLDRQVKIILEMFLINDVNQIVDTLSTGQKKRVALASIVLQQPDVVFLDEVTNHLDMEMIEWLETYFSASEMTVFLITHDRYFLDKVCTRIIELDQQTIFSYRGNYSYFLEKKSEREEAELSHSKKMKNIMRRELEWLRRQPKARGSKSKSRVEAFDDISDQARRPESKQLRTMELKIDRLGGKIIEMHQLKKNFGEKKIIDGFNYVFKGGDKIGMAGPNGAGKTTFIKLMIGEMKPDGGKVVIGDTVKIGYFGQETIKVEESMRVIEVVREIAEFIPITKGRTISAEQLLEQFLFPRRQQRDYVAKLSGGEKRRLQMLTVLMRNPNLLILDEPTNDLDIVTLNILEDYLRDFPGCLLVVSHDRYFLEKVNNHFFIFEGKGVIRDFYGTFREYKEQQQNHKTETTTKKAQVSDRSNSEEVKQKLSYKEKKEFDLLEKEIPELEIKKNKLLTALNTGEQDFSELENLSKELSSISQQIEDKENRWLELSEFLK